MAYWLLKTEPTDFGYADLERDDRTAWSGVRNALAQKHLRAARRGDGALVYHTGGEKAVVGVAKVVSDPYPDPRDPKLAVVDVAADRPLARPVTLAEIKADPAFADFALVRLGRLSVMPVAPALWRRLLRLGGG
jgi:predicted RNA-binding protein with PUA-like domain